MRGTPFLKEGWTGGLNTIDSPYTVEETQARDCLNVVSTTKGAIRKRNGSTIFASFTSASFPALSATDSFQRAEEDPLSNGGQWSPVEGFEPGRILKGESWGPSRSGESEAIWNVTKQKNPAVALEWHEKEGALEPSFWIYACLQSTTMRTNGYRVLYENSIVRISKIQSNHYTTLAEATPTELVPGDFLGLTVRAGIVTAWRKHSGVWRKIIEAADTTFTEGYAGIATNNGQFRNFSLGEVAAPTTEVELSSLATVNVSSGKYMIASNGANLFSINTGGEVAQIGEGFTAGAKWEVLQAPATTAKPNQGPVYLVNGVDKPQYWTGAAKNTSVAEWTGIESQPKLTDGHANKATPFLKSASAGFIAGDVGLLVIFETEVKVAGSAIKEALIEEVISPTEVKLAINEEGFEAEYTGVHFTLERAYYEKEKHVPNGQYMVFHGNRIWMTGIKADPSAVWFSELVSIGEGGAQADPSAWPKTNVVRFESSDAYPITALGSVGPYLVVFKENRAWIIHDINTGANRQLSDTIGCVANRSVVETNSGTFFLTADQGVYLTDGTHLHEMSYIVRPTILGINPTQRSSAAGAYFNNHYYLSFAAGTATSNNRTLDYDVQLKSWWLHDLTGNQWTSFEANTGEPALFTCPPRAKAGVVKAFVANVFTDSGTSYTGNGVLGAFWVGNWEPFAYYVFRHRIKAPFLKKRVRQVFFNGSGEIIPIVYRDFIEGGTQEPATIGTANQARPTFPADFEQGTTIFGNEDETQLFGGELYEGVQMIYGGAQQVGGARLYALGVGFVWSLGFGNNSPQPFEVDAAGWMIQFRKS